ncbi:MAG: DUF2585 domain-containing protein [Sphingopyxis sp.]|jgi:hypothetical protein|nr:DUF2585 domain-containing protein [Sphingopyxis sp.]
MAIGKKWWLVIIALMIATAVILLWMGRPAICTCGTIKLWEPGVNTAGNSQHIADWYTPSHIIHGAIFYALTHWLMRWKQSGPRPIGIVPHGDFALGPRLVMAAALELAWELVENSPAVIERYRAATVAVGYNGDSVLNSMADCGWMLLGFYAAHRMPWKVTFGAAIAFELLTLWIIRDNLTLNVLMLVAPSDAIKAWQAAL